MDEKMRKQLLNWFKDCHWDSIDDGTLKRDDIIAWIEKQDEQHQQEKQQWIDKTTKWLEEQDFGGWIESETYELINEFKQFAKEEL